MSLSVQRIRTSGYPPECRHSFRFRILSSEILTVTSTTTNSRPKRNYVRSASRVISEKETAWKSRCERKCRSEFPLIVRQTQPCASSGVAAIAAFLITSTGLESVQFSQSIVISMSSKRELRLHSFAFGRVPTADPTGTHCLYVPSSMRFVHPVTLGDTGRLQSAKTPFHARTRRGSRPFRNSGF